MSEKITDEQVKLDFLSSKDEQLKILIPYLEKASNSEDKKPLPLIVRSIVLADRYLRGWRDYILVKQGAITEEGAFLYYQKLIEGE